jgi:hypothetical protein
MRQPSCVDSHPNPGLARCASPRRRQRRAGRVAGQNSRFRREARSDDELVATCFEKSPRTFIPVCTSATIGSSSMPTSGSEPLGADGQALAVPPMAVRSRSHGGVVEESLVSTFAEPSAVSPAVASGNGVTSAVASRPSWPLVSIEASPGRRRRTRESPHAPETSGNGGTRGEMTVHDSQSGDAVVLGSGPKTRRWGPIGLCAHPLRRRTESSEDKSTEIRET